MTRILVLGGTSFIGPAVVRWLVDNGHEVATFNRGRTQADLPEGIVRIRGERSRIAEAREAFEQFRPDVAIDMYAMTEQDARLASEALTGVAGRLVAVSSMDVYRAYDRLRGADPGPPDQVPLTEDSPLREKLYPYREHPPAGLDRDFFQDYDKILVERVVMDNPEMPGTILRLPMVYGERDRQHRYWPYLKRMDDGRPAIVLNERLARWRNSWGYVENIGAAIALAATDGRAANRTYLVAEPDAPTTTELLGQLATVTGWRGEVVTVPDDQLSPGINPDQHFVADSSRIRGELGYEEAVPRDEALRRTIAWERANPPENPMVGIDYEEEDALLER